MRNFGLHFILILSALVVAGVVVADAVAYTWDDAEWLFLEKINDARANPLAAAEALGVDVQELAVSQPLFHAAIKDGIPILETDDRLSAAATGHAQEMVDFDFLSKRSLNGETYQDRLTLVGYPAGSTGESLGLLIFQNFIGVEDAINLLVAQILRKEYSFEGRFDRNILDPEFTRVGIGLKAGTTNVNGTDRNAYFLTCDFALDRTTDQGSKAEEEELILSLINQARRRPLATAEALGIDLATLAVNRPHFFDEWVQGAEALGPDDVLKWQALLAVSLHLEGLVPSGQAFSADGGGDWTVKKPYRILEKPDLSLVVGHRVIYDETLGSDNATAMCALVNRIVMDEMILWERTTPGILSRQVNEAGIILSRRGGDHQYRRTGGRGSCSDRPAIQHSTIAHGHDPLFQ